MNPLHDWLKGIGLERLVSLFEEQEIDWEILPKLTDSDIDRLNLPLGTRRRLLSALSRLNEAGSVETPLMSGIARRAAQRRQMTVMFCDVVGFVARSTQLEPEALRDLVDRYRRTCSEIVESLGGHVAQTIGDGIMIYFGWPTATENDAERAVRAALAITREVKTIDADPPLDLHIGVATGTVVVGQSDHGDYTSDDLAMGETPNLASRLQNLAQANEIIISDLTKRLLGGGFELTDLGSRVLKGIVKPVQVWRVEAVRVTAGRFAAAHHRSALTPLVGRNEELALLLRYWRQATKGEGRAVLIGGEAGIGKSRLISDLQDAVMRDGPLVLLYQCSAVNSRSPLHPVREQIERDGGFERHDSIDHKLDKLERWLPQGLKDVDESRALICNLLDLPQTRYPPLNLGARRQKTRTLELLGTLLHLQSEASPVLLVVEDAHWIDPTTLEWLEPVLANLRSSRVLALVSFRPSEFTPPWVGKDYAAMMVLDKLSTSDGLAMITNLMQGVAIPEAVRAEIASRADGVPLFVEELTKSVVESGDPQALTDWHASVGARHISRVPGTLRESLVARLDRLSPVKSIIDVAACMGREFTADVICFVSGLTEHHVEQGLQALVASGLMFRHGVVPNESYTFKHVLIQDVAYDSLVLGKKQSIHATIAQVLQERFSDTTASKPELVAHHLTRAGQWDAAIDWWGKAGDLAMRRVALQEAKAHYKDGLDLLQRYPSLPEMPARALALRAPLHACLVGLHGWASPEVRSNGLEILNLAETQEDQQALGLGMWALWVNTITQGRVAESLDWARKLLERGERSQDIDLMILGHAGTMISSFYLGDLLKAKSCGERVLELYDESKAARWLQMTMNDYKTVVGIWACQWTWMLGYPDQAVRISEEKDLYARKLGHPFNLGFALSLGAYCFDYRGEHAELLKRVTEADQIEREHSVPFVNRVMVRQVEGLARLRAGDFDAAVELLEQSLRDWNAYGGNSRVPYLKSALAEAKAAAGAVDDGLRLIDECLEQIHRPGWQERSHYSEVLRLKAWMLMKKSQWDAAEVLLREGITWAHEQQAKSWELRCAMTLAEVYLARGEGENARQTLAPVYGWFTEGFETRDLRAARDLLERIG